MLEEDICVITAELILPVRNVHTLNAFPTVRTRTIGMNSRHHLIINNQ